MMIVVLIGYTDDEDGDKDNNNNNIDHGDMLRAIKYIGYVVLLCVV